MICSSWVSKGFKSLVCINCVCSQQFLVACWLWSSGFRFQFKRGVVFFPGLCAFCVSAFFNRLLRAFQAHDFPRLPRVKNTLGLLLKTVKNPNTGKRRRFA